MQLKIHNVLMSLFYLIHVTTEMIKLLQWLSIHFDTFWLSHEQDAQETSEHFEFLIVYSF